VLRGLGADLGAEVLACRAWPGLAARLAQWQTRGLPLDELIADLPAARLATARFPAAYARSVLAATIAARHGDLGSTEHTDSEPTRERRSSPHPGPGSARTRTDTNRGDGPAEGAAAKHRASTQDPRRLDPASAVDRVGIAARLGTGSIADDEARQALLDRAAAPRNRGGDQPAAAAATAEAGGHPVTAVPGRNAPAASATDARNNPDGAATARVDEHRSAAERAAAAEAARGVGSAAARAEVTLTPPSTPAPTPAPTPASTTPSPGHPRVMPPPRPPRPRLTPTPRRRPS
jgi:hypothetical protein